MGTANHYDHFLERTNRIEDEQLDFAMALYYDPEFVRAFLNHYQIPDGYERVAIALDPGDDSPHIVLARDGGFVTCLGGGMSIRGLYRIPYAKIEGHHRLHGALRESVKRSEKDGVGVRQIKALIHRKNLSLNRRDFARLEALQPLLLDQAVLAGYELSDSLDRKRRILTTRLGKGLRRLNANQEADVRNYWQQFFYMHHLSVLAAMGTEQLAALIDIKGVEALFGDMPWWTWREGMSGPCLRAMWCAGRMGAVMADHFIQWTREADTPEMIHCGVACLMTIAFRHPQHYRRIERLFRGWRDGIKQLPEHKLSIRQKYQQAQSTVALQILDQPEGAEYAFLERSLRNIAYFLVNHGIGLDLDPDDPEAGDIPLGPVGLPSEFGPMKALAFAVLETTDIREQLDEFVHLLTAAPLLARAEVSDLYPSPELASYFPDWVPEYGITLFYHHAEQRRVSPPVTVDKTPGRNDPCACGSGRKYKRCCLHQQA